MQALFSESLSHDFGIRPRSRDYLPIIAGRRFAGNGSSLGACWSGRRRGRPFLLAGLTGVGLGGGASAGGCSACVVTRSGAEALVSGTGAGVCGGAAEVAGEGDSTGGSVFFAIAVLRACSVGEEFRPTIYPMEKNTPSRITTIRKTLISCRFPRTNSNSPSSFLAKMNQPSCFFPPK